MLEQHLSQLRWDVFGVSHSSQRSPALKDDSVLTSFSAVVAAPNEVALEGCAVQGYRSSGTVSPIHQVQADTDGRIAFDVLQDDWIDCQALFTFWMTGGPDGEPDVHSPHGKAYQADR